jgi:hypothetical protein
VTSAMTTTNNVRVLRFMTVSFRMPSVPLQIAVYVAGSTAAISVRMTAVV